MATKRRRKKEQTAYSKIKELQIDRKQQRDLKSSLIEKKKEIDRRISAVDVGIKRKDKEINDVKNSIEVPELTDHARLQFFRRCLGFDIKKIDELILTERMKQAVEIAGNTGKFPFQINDVEEIKKSLIREDFEPSVNFAARIKRGIVVTVVND